MKTNNKNEVAIPPSGRVNKTNLYPAANQTDLAI